MSEIDLRLIEQAFEYYDGSDWNLIEKLEAQAESDKAKEILRDRKRHLYHKEEQFANQF